MVYHGAYAVLLALHLAAVVFVVGPLVATALQVPRLLRAAADTDPASRAVHASALRSGATRIQAYAGGTVVVVGLGFAMVGHGTIGTQWSLSNAWISASLALWLVAVALTVLGPGRALRSGADVVTGDHPAHARALAGRAAALGGLAALCWLAIIVLMVLKPGH